MEREFLSNFKVGDTALPDVIIDTIMEEHKRDLAAATTHPGDNGDAGGKTFTQEDVNRIVSERLAREREKATQPPQEDEREKALKVREARLDCRDYLDREQYSVKLLDILDYTDPEQFKTVAEKLAKAFPGINRHPVPPPYAPGPGTGPAWAPDVFADAFKRKT